MDIYGNPVVQYDEHFRVIPQKPPVIHWTMPKDEKCGGSGEPEVYVLMRFKSDVKERVRTACYLEKKVIENYGGRVLGISDGVAIYEGNSWDVNMSVLLLHFPSKTRAEQWLFSDRKFRDKEWPLPASSLEIVIMPLLYKPPKTALTFQLIELRDFMDEKFQNQYVEKVAPLMDKYRIKHGVVATYDVTGNRNSWIGPKTYCLLNAYESETNLDAFYYSDEYGPHKGYRQSVCRTDNVVFTLDPCLKAPKS